MVLRSGTIKSHAYTYDGSTFTFYHGGSGSSKTKYELYIDGYKISIGPGIYDNGWIKSHSTTKDPVEVKIRSAGADSNTWMEHVYSCPPTIRTESRWDNM